MADLALKLARPSVRLRYGCAVKLNIHGREKGARALYTRASEK